METNFFFDGRTRRAWDASGLRSCVCSARVCSGISCQFCDVIARCDRNCVPSQCALDVWEGCCVRAVSSAIDRSFLHAFMQSLYPDATSVSNMSRVNFYLMLCVAVGTVSDDENFEKCARFR